MKAQLFTVSTFLFSIALLALLVPGGTPPSSAQPQPAAPLAPANAAAPATERVYPTAADAQNVELVGQIGGAIYTVAVQENYAYIGVGPRLVVLDVSDPANPTVAGQTAMLPDVVQDIHIASPYAYVADANAGLRVIDVSNPAAPMEVGAYDTPGDAVGVYVISSYAYVADENAGLRVVDISNPAAPVEVGACETPVFAYGVYVAGGYAYVADYYAGLRVVDVSNPAAPVEVGAYETLAATGVFVVGSYAYVAGAGLRVIDVSNPAAPVEVGVYDTPGGAAGVYVTGSYTYVADGLAGLRVVDVSDLATPVEVGVYDTPGTAGGVYVAGGYAYVADGWGGLIILRYTGTGPTPTPTVSPTATSTPMPTETSTATATATSEWLNEAVDFVGSCFNSGASLVLDSDGAPHISYYDYGDSALMYAYRTASGWVTTVVDNSEAVGIHSSIALNSSGYPHISYRDATNNALKYAHWDGANWIVETVGGIGESGWYTSLALDSGDRPHISYLGSGQKPKYAHWTGSNWEISVVDPTWTSRGTSLALDSLERAHISYGEDERGDLRYASYNGSQWIIETVEVGIPGDNSLVGAYSSLAIDDADNPHISYARYGETIGGDWPNDLKYAWKQDGSWQFASPDTAGAVGYYTSIALDTWNRPHISYYDQDNHALKYIYSNGTGWADFFVDSPVILYGSTSLKLDQNGLPHIAYCDGTSDYLKYARTGYAAPSADFIATPLSGTAPLNVQFTDQSTGDITTWDWTFGDGSISGARHPSHIYEDPGTYTVSLTVRPWWFRH